jgi:hypothetical protein
MMCNKLNLCGSVSYDFHVRQFQTILELPPREYDTLDLVDVMKAFTRHNSRRPLFSRCRMLHCECFVDEPSLSGSLFQYILKNPQRYGFRPILFDGNATACYLSSEFPDFSINGSETMFERGSLTYTVVLYASADQDDATLQSTITANPASTYIRSVPLNSRRSTEGKLCLRYFLLISDRQSKFPVELESSTPSYLDHTTTDVLKEYMSGGCYLGDVAKFAENKIKKLVEQVCGFRS